MTAIAGSNVHLRLTSPRFGEWCEAGVLVVLTAIAVIALSIPVVLVLLSIVDVLTWLIGRM